MTAFDTLMTATGMSKQAGGRANDAETAAIVQEIFDDGTGAKLTAEQFAEEVRKRYAKKYNGKKPNISKTASTLLTIPSVGYPGVGQEGSIADAAANVLSSVFGKKDVSAPITGRFDLDHTGQVDRVINSVVNKADKSGFDPSSIGKNLPNIQAEDASLSDRVFGGLKDSMGSPKAPSPWWQPELSDRPEDPSLLQQAADWLGKKHENVLGTGMNIPNWAILASILGAGGLATLGINKLVSNDNDNEKPEEEDMNNQLTEQQLKTAAVLNFLQKQAQAKAMRAQDPTEGPAIPQRPTLNQKSSLERLLEITRTRGLQNQDFGQHGMSSVKSAGTVEQAKDPDEKGQLEKRPDLTPGSSLQKLLQIVQSNKLKKSAANHVVGPNEGKLQDVENNWAKFGPAYDLTRGFLDEDQLQAIQRQAFEKGLGPQDIYQQKDQLTGKPEPIAAANNEVEKREQEYHKAYGTLSPFHRSPNATAQPPVQKPTVNSPGWLRAAMNTIKRGRGIR